jgi:hypothetical protein
MACQCGCESNPPRYESAARPPGSDATSSTPISRRFPPPWSVEEQDAGFVVCDHNGQQLAYVYFEDEPGRKIGGKITDAG